MPMSPRLLRPRASGLFNPASISTLQLWAEPSATRVFSNDAGTTAANNGDGVAVVTSRTGTNLVQTIQANRPQLVTNARYGRPCLRFDGLNDSLSFSSALAQSLGQHIFAAVDTTNLQNAANLVFLERTGASGSNLAIYLSGNQNRRPSVYYGIHRAIWGAAVTAPAVVRWHVRTSVTEVQVNNQITVSGDAGTASLTNWTSVTNSAVQQAQFDLFELLIFSSITATEITTVNNYLMLKYRIT